MTDKRKIAKPLDHQAKQLIYNVYKYYKKRKLDITTSEFQEDVNLVVLISEVTGIKQGVVKNVIKNGNSMTYECGSANFKPRENKRNRAKRIVVDEFTQCIIRRKMLQFPSLRKVVLLLKEENILKCSMEYLRLLLHSLGFSKETFPGQPSLLIESSKILSDRMSYLYALKDHVEQGRSVFYLSNTKNWTNAKNTTKDMPCFVMMHASGPGFIDNVPVMLKIKPMSIDDECFEHFENYDWMKDIVLPNIPPASLVIVDIPQELKSTSDTQMGSEMPTENSSILDLKEWLKHQNISFKETASQPELMELVKSQEARMEFSVTKLIKESGHHLLHLPQNHCDLNPVAVMWHKVKENANETPAYELFTQYSKNEWKCCILHVKENEAEYFAYEKQVNDSDYIKKLGGVSKKNSKVTSDPSDSSDSEKDMD